MKNTKWFWIVGVIILTIYLLNSQQTQEEIKINLPEGVPQPPLPPDIQSLDLSDLNAPSELQSIFDGG